MRIFNFKIIIIFILILFPFYFFGQGKQIHYIKTVKHSSVDYANKNARSFISNIIIQKQDESGLHYSKDIHYDTNGVVVSYSLSCYKNDGVESIHISWRKHENNLFIEHSIADTIRNTVYELTYHSNNSGDNDNCSLSINRIDHIDSDIQLKTDEVKKYYLDCLEKDYEKLDSFGQVPFPDINRFKKLKNRYSFFREDKTENYKIWESYFIDSIFIDGNLDKIDTILKEKSKIFYKTENGITEYKRDYYLGTSHTFEGYTYDSIQQKTEQLLYKTNSENDTLYRISSDTKLEMKAMVSNYKIIGNYPDERNFYYGSYYPKEFIFKERTIRVVRDTSGYKISGEANGITREDVKVKCTFYTEPPSKDFNQYILREITSPSKLSENNKGKVYQNYYFDYSIITMLPNIDLKPLIKFNYITSRGTVGVIIDENCFPIKSYSKGVKNKRHRKRNSLKPEYKIETKRIEKNKKNNFEIWKREEYGGMENTIYEVYFK